MGRIKRFFAFLILILPAFSTLFADEFKISAVQLRISPELYSSAEKFENEISRIVAEAVKRRGPDLIVFPEYTGVFASFFPFNLDSYAGGSVPLSVRDNPGRALQTLDPEAKSPFDFFVRHNPSKILDEIFGGIAQSYDVHIIGGSYFEAVLRGNNIQLRNRAVLYGPEGKRVYQQDKVFLTPYEIDILGISPGNLSKASEFEIDDTVIGLTICRDTFFEDWEIIFADVDVWIDIKANGQIFTAIQQDNFRQALPERMDSTDIPVGITVCLTGNFYDLLWQGKSFIVESADDGTIKTVARAKDPEKQEVLFIEVD